VRTRSVSPEVIECPLCSGGGELTRAEILDRLGVKDFARVAQLSAEEAFRLLQSKHDHDHQIAWSRFETELTKRVAETREQHNDEVQTLQSRRDDLTRRVEDRLREVAELREQNQELEMEFSKTARIGKREEVTFEREVRTWAGVWISDKLPRNGDFILAYRAPNGEPLDPRILIDNKDKCTIAESDIDKLVRDSNERSIPIAALVVRE
jgi:predicted RNase H-like nuclease (RuvC/YqgF family)